MLAEILERGTALLAELEAAPLADTRFKAAEDIPPNVQHAEGYIAFLGNPAHTQDWTSPKKSPNIVRFPGRLIGPQVGTGISYKSRYNLLRYADLINQKFIERPDLANSARSPLAGVEECVFVSGEVIEDEFPRGSGLVRLQYLFTLQIRFNRFRQLSR